MKNFRIVLAVTLALLTAALSVTLSGCNSEGEKSTLNAMDTVMNFELFGTHAKEAQPQLKELCERYDDLFSTTKENSDISRVNAAKGQPATVDEATFELVQNSIKLCSESDGALDITVLPFVHAWGFDQDKQQIPAGETLDVLMPLVNYNLIQMKPDETAIAVPEGVGIDLGAVAKGYLADKAVEMLKENKVRKALLNFGGTVAAHGSKFLFTPWKIGIADPKKPSDFFGFVSCSNKVIATSGGYERYFTDEDGTRYIHIIDPSTGRTVDNGIESVTVISESGLTADALSTALFVKGLVGAENYWLAHQDEFDFVILDSWGKVYVTQGIMRSFSLEEGHSDLEVIEITASAR